MLDVAWDRYQPTADTVDAGYVQQLRSRIRTCRDAGLALVLSMGLQYPPGWVRSLPGGTYIGQSGVASQHGEVDLVFGAAVRGAVRAYLERFAADIGFTGVAGIRVGTNATGEFGYPGPGEAGGDHEFWAFGPAAQHGDGLAAGATASPLPGWVPGQAEWRGRPVTAEQTAAWFDWYTRSLVTALAWQIDELYGLGFSGRFHVPVAGRGVLPADLAAAVAVRLDGTGDPDGALERGLDYLGRFPQLAEIDARLRAGGPGQGLDVDVTGIDDDTAVRARALDPAQDTCRADDVDRLPSRPDTVTWSAQRWTVANARLVGLPVVGENPGPPDAPFTGGSRHSDSAAQQLAHALGYTRDCGLAGFHWAFEDDLFSPTSGVDLDAYARAISQAAG